MSIRAGAARIASPEAAVMASFQNVTKSFGAFKALDRVQFEIKQGEILGLLGPNGAGKTTAMRILAGYFPPTNGRVTIDGSSIADHPEKAKRRVGYVPETVQLYGDQTVLEFLDFVAQIKGVSRPERSKHVEDILYRCGLWEVRRRLIGRLSKGFRQRVGFAQAILGDPGVLILDEPTTGLDPTQIHKIRELIRELGRDRAVILSTHILPEVSLVCDRVAIINRGRLIAEGTVAELEAGLKPGQEVRLTTGEAHRRENITAWFESIAGIRSVQVTDEREGRLFYSLFAAEGYEVRPEITRRLVQENVPLYEMTANRLGLEEIFLSLVLQDPATPAEGILP